MTSSVHFDHAHPDALVVCCSDGRFTGPIDEHMRGLGHARFDTLTIPGGPGLLNLGGMAGIMQVDHVRSSLGFLVRGHSIRHVVLCSHEGCGWYAQHRHHVPDVGVAQAVDLIAAANWIRGIFGDEVDVRTFHATACHGGDVVTFVEGVTT